MLIAEVPTPKNDKPTLASRQYQMIAEHPYLYTSNDVIFTIYAECNSLEASEQRQALFAKSQPCLRLSPLTKRYGWGVHTDAEGSPLGPRV